MADGLFNLCGRRTVEVSKDGKVYRLAVRSLADYARKEEAMLMKMGSPFIGLDAIADPAIRTQAFKIAADVAARPLIATTSDEDRFDRSFRGMAWGLWRALCVHHPTEFPPDLPAEQGIQLGCDFIAWYADVQGLVSALHRVEEKDIVGNSKAPADQPQDQ